MNCAHLFSIRPVRGYITFNEVREIYESAKFIPNPVNKEAFYASQGLDMERVEALFPNMDKAERAWEATLEAQRMAKIREEREKGRTFSFGKWKVSVWQDPDV